jgi:mitochondrial fission protein ELM1
MADSEYAGIASQVVSRLRNETEASIFVCTGRRTDTSTLKLMMMNLETELDKAGRSDDINLLQYDFRENRNTDTFNPYIGLIDRSDHIVVCGDSYSIVSEALSKQKAIYMNSSRHYFEDYMPLIKRGLVKDFNEINLDEPFIKTPVHVTNPTERSANRIISRYKRHCCTQMGFWRGMAAYTLGI